jgi:hypothetical protein
MPEYRIDFTITMRGPDDDDFKEIGFGSSGAWNSIGAAEYEVGSIIDNRQWETQPGMPDPESVNKEC